MKVLGVMLVRSGSTRLPHKNFMQFSGKKNLKLPLYYWNMNTMLEDKQIDKVVISTDVPEKFKDIKVKQWKDKLDIIERPDKYCTKEATSEESLIWTVNQYSKEYDTIFFTQCTTPFLSGMDIWKTLEEFEKDELNSIISVNKYTMKPNGMIYLVDREALLKHGTYFTPNMGIYMMEHMTSVDIDYLYQFRVAEAVSRGDVFE